MKKNLKTISKYLLLLILFIPCFVKADMGPPMMTEYQVRVTNPNGTTAINTEGEEIRTFKYDEIIKVNYEKIINNELYGGNFGELVKLSDTKLVTDVVDLEKFKNERKQKYYIFDDTNVLYKGPSKTYGKVEPETTLKKGSIVETEYYDQLWAYVEQDGVKGWVYTYTYTDVAPYEEQPGMAIYATDWYNGSVKVKKTIEEKKIYKSPKEKEVIATIPKDTNVNIIYVYNDEPKFPYYYVSYDGKKGWVKAEAIEIEGNSFLNMLNQVVTTNSTYKVDNSNGISMYKEYNSTSEILETIPNNTILDVKYELIGNYHWPWYQVEYNGKTGWVKGENVKIDDNGTTSQPDNNNTEEEQETNIPNTEDTTMEKDEEQEKLSPREIIIICITTAVVASLTAFVTIKLINKKKETKI